MDNERTAIICVATDEKEIGVPVGHGPTAEEACVKVCKALHISPLACPLFSLRVHSTLLFLPLSSRLEPKHKHRLDFRLRFKPSSLRRLKEVDGRAYDYYFLQARADVMENRVPEIVYERHKRELIGLGVSDMYRVMLEKRVPRETVESDYKKYIPKECIKRHAFFIKKPIHLALCKISGHDASYVKEQYLKQFESMAPNYPYEEYKALMDKGLAQPAAKVTLRVNGEEVKVCEGDTSLWSRLCGIEDLCFISIREDNTVEISRKTGIPSYLKFSTAPLLLSFVSCLDGYYRLSVKWTFNLCREVVTPGLERLHRMKCHGPVGQDFAYSKLQEKKSNRPGCYLLRESETDYNVYYVDAFDKDGKLFTKRIQEISENDFVVTGLPSRFPSIPACLASLNLPPGDWLPASEYDRSPLLLCAPRPMGDEAADELAVAAVLEAGPRCVPSGQLEIGEYIKRDDGRGNGTEMRRAVWRLVKGKRLEVALKVLKEEEGGKGKTKEFLELAGKWAQLRSGTLVRLFGVTLSPPAMLLEQVSLGPLDSYLSTCPNIATVDLVEAAACLATALWHLEESGVVHGRIRCSKLLVHAHSSTTLTVKLADPGLFVYTHTDVHWLPPECYTDPDTARRSFSADVWAVGTTVWQIFARGAPLPQLQDASIAQRFYSSGRRLPPPSGCPTEVHKLMVECWGDGAGSRKQPQAIMRDINQILYQVYNSRRSHAYATAFPKLFNSEKERDRNGEEDEDTNSIGGESATSSLVTDNTSLPWNDTDDSTQGLIPPSPDDLSAYLNWLSPDPTPKSLRVSQPGELLSYELDMDCNVILQGRIGQGFYGEVYRGTLERENGKENQLVAIKKLKTRALEADIKDFEREIAIMKTLKHPNVVEILGVISEPEVCLVMEYVKHGSLQSYLSIHRQQLTHRKLLGFALDIATGMDYLGRMSIVHRDLAARNILVADESRVKISDFGLAQVTGKNDYYILQTNRDLPIKWYAPESLRDGKFSSRSDVWSFGVTMFETFGLGEEPRLPGLGFTGRLQNEQQEGTTELLEALQRGARLPCPASCPQTIYVKIMYPCWQLHSHQRPDFATLCEDIRELLTQY